MIPAVNRHTALLLDIDGTLLDMASSPERVVVPADLVRALGSLAHELSGALAFVSGRSLENIDRLFAPFRPAAIGAHGGEVRGVDGRIARAAPLPGKVREIFVGLKDDIPGLLLEDKGCAMALHYRLAPEARPVLHAALEREKDLLAAANVTLLEGKAVIDARPAGIDKGVGVRALMRQPPFHGRRVVFGGDDTTDQDVFEILPEMGGTGFSVTL